MKGEKLLSWVIFNILWSKKQPAVMSAFWFPFNPGFTRLNKGKPVKLVFYVTLPHKITFATFRLRHALQFFLVDPRVYS